MMSRGEGGAKVKRCQTLPAWSAIRHPGSSKFDDCSGCRYAAIPGVNGGAEMSKESQGDEADYATPQELRSWLSQEIKDMTRAFDLRLREATDLVTAYSLGDLTPEQADERSWRYQHRWGEALPGTS